MDDPRPVQMLAGLTVSGALGAITLVTSGLATLASMNVTGTAVVGTSLVVTGPVTGASFSGVGTSLTALNASNLTSGTLPLARLGTVGTPDTTTFFRGDNSWVAAVTSVTIAAANGISASVSNQGTTPQLTITLGAITPSSVNTSGSVTAGSFVGGTGSFTTLASSAAATLASAAVTGGLTVGTTLDVTGDITATSLVVDTVQASGTVFSVGGFTGPGAGLAGLNASNLGSGTVALGRLGTGTPDSTKFLSGTNAWATAVTAVTVATANGVSGTIANQGTTPAITIVLGAITPSSVAATGNVGGATISSTGLATLNSVSVTNNASVGGTLSTSGAITAPSFTGAMIGTGTYSPVLTTGVFTGVNAAIPTIPQFGLIATAAPTNAKASTFYVASTGTLNWALLQDDLATNASFMTVARTGITATNITFIGTTITLDGNAVLETVSSSGLATLASLSVSASATIAASLTVSGAASIAGALSASSVTTTGAYNTLTLASSGNATVGGTLVVSGASTLNSASVTNALTVGTTVNASGVITGSSFVATGNTAPTVGIYEGSATGGISVATNSIERWSVTTAGLITNRSAAGMIITALTTSSVDCSKGNYFTRTYSSAQTWTFTNVPTGVFYRFTLRMIRGASGSAQTWPSTVRWSGGSAPSFTNTVGGSDILEFMTDDGGTKWRAYRISTTTS